ncbi:N-acetyl-gamma-glutamyl-phosphate reductase [Clostridium sp. P21]|uniref:N-acetyl-gamma-glutamyl-phosphate reductase n=1 Tax=Clostridium muellerianum TaxID=2716538 RepID=A0A7Y0EDF1_9CLOT|nr:N-acetyl-gamma-glutamyl-phosphate reductase [Clostridium muellerianum]NMM61326.1 N-acetyl-gamma-glutamyl-phosphate reductase [Clostridium muellerianum]
MIKVGIIGSTGYAGQQLVWLLQNHPSIEIVFLCSHSYENTLYKDIYKNFNGFIDDLCINIHEAEYKLNCINMLFLALPHGKSFNITKKALEKGVKVIDLGADFRINSENIYEQWYKVKHTSPELLKESVYGLTELNRNHIKKASLIANPGCYPTASILALAPLLKLNLVDKSSIIIDAKSGISGAGRNASIGNIFAECNESIKAYSVGEHRHTPEIEQELGLICNDNITLTFTPHLVPMNRGILSVCYSKLICKKSQEEIYKIYKDFYKNEFFIKITDTMPETRWVKGSNLCHIGIRLDERTGRVIIASCIDNLIKGAAGQAVQNMNLMFNLDEKTGLDFPAMMP